MGIVLLGEPERPLRQALDWDFISVGGSAAVGQRCGTLHDPMLVVVFLHLAVFLLLSQMLF